MPKLVGGALIFAGIMVLLVTQFVRPGLAKIGWWLGAGLIALGTVPLLEPRGRV